MQLRLLLASDLLDSGPGSHPQSYCASTVTESAEVDTVFKSSFCAEVAELWTTTSSMVSALLLLAGEVVGRTS